MNPVDTGKERRHVKNPALRNRRIIKITPDTKLNRRADLTFSSSSIKLFVNPETIKERIVVGPITRCLDEPNKKYKIHGTNEV